MLSDLILGGFAFYFFIQHRFSNKLWSMFFLMMSLSAFVGGIYHGFPEIGEEYRFLSWAFLSVSLIYAQLAAHVNFKSTMLNWIFVLKGSMFLYLSIHYADFAFMVVDTAVSLLGFVILSNILYIKSLSSIISYGIVISFASVFFIVFRINFHPEYMTYNDIGHYFTIVSLMVMSKGIREDSMKQILSQENND
jgi:hypothetical protein